MYTVRKYNKTKYDLIYSFYLAFGKPSLCGELSAPKLSTDCCRRTSTCAVAWELEDRFSQLFLRVAVHDKIDDFDVALVDSSRGVVGIFSGIVTDSDGLFYI